MAKPTDIRLCEVASSTQYLKYRAPIKFGGRVVTDAVLLDVSVEVETRRGLRGRGCGSMPMSNTWAWPSRQVPADQALAAMIALGRQAAEAAAACPLVGHPLEITRSLAAEHDRAAAAITRAGRPERAHAPAGSARGRQPAGGRHPRRLRQGPGPQLLPTAWGPSSPMPIWPPT